MVVVLTELNKVMAELLMQWQGVTVVVLTELLMQ